jgi:hypothetical protein
MAFDSNFTCVALTEKYGLPNTFDPTYSNTTTTKAGLYQYVNAFGNSDATFQNCSNDINGNAGTGGFRFQTVDSQNDDFKLMELLRDKVVVNTQLTNESGNTILDLTNNNLNLIAGTGTTFLNGSRVRSLDTAQTYQTYTDITPAQIVLTNQNNDSNTNIQPQEILIAGYTAPQTARLGKTGLTLSSVDSETALNFYRLLLTDTSEGNTSTTKIQPANGFLLYKTLSSVGKINSNINFFNENNSPRIVIDDNTSTNTITKNTITLNDTVHNSQLTTTDLLFNGVSFSRNLIINSTKSINQYISAVIYADGRPPTAPTSTITQSYAFTPAWYFKNTTAGYKINWYIGPNVNMTVAQVLGIYMNIFNASTTSNDNTPFLTIYTQPQAGDSTFFHSKRTYVFNLSITPTTNTRYNMFMNVSGNCPTPSVYGSTLNNMELSPVGGGNVGPFASTELILAFAIGTNSASAVNSVEFAINKFGIMTPTGTTDINFIPST